MDRNPRGEVVSSAAKDLTFQAKCFTSFGMTRRDPRPLSFLLTAPALSLPTWVVRRKQDRILRVNRKRRVVADAVVACAGCIDMVADPVGLSAGAAVRGGLELDMGVGVDHVLPPVAGGVGVCAGHLV